MVRIKSQKVSLTRSRNGNGKWWAVPWLITRGRDTGGVWLNLSNSVVVLKELSALRHRHDVSWSDQLYCNLITFRQYCYLIYCSWTIFMFLIPIVIFRIPFIALYFIANGSLPNKRVKSLFRSRSISYFTSTLVSTFSSYNLFTSSSRHTNGTSYPAWNEL